MTNTGTASSEPTYRLKEDGVIWRETGGEIVVLDLNGSTYFGLNPTGSLLWKALQQGVSRADLVAELMTSTAVGEAQGGADVDAFLTDLEREGLLLRG